MSLDDADIDAEIQNVVANANVDINGTNSINVEKISKEYDGAELDYDIVNFDAAKYQHNNTAIMLFASGSLVSTGSPSTKAAWEAIESFAEDFKDIGIEVSDRRITNYVGTINIDKELHLYKLAVAFSIEDSEYEPEQFPGLIVRRQGYVAILFGNGKIVITSCDTLEQIDAAAADLLSELEKYLDLM